MRQPHALRTAPTAKLLDQVLRVLPGTPHVHSHAVKQVKLGLEQEGLTGLGDAVTGNCGRFSSASPSSAAISLRTPPYSCPKCCINTATNGLSWTTRSTYCPPSIWDAIQAPDTQSAFPDRAKRQTASVDVGDALPVFQADRELYIDKTIQAPNGSPAAYPTSCRTRGRRRAS